MEAQKKELFSSHGSQLIGKRKNVDGIGRKIHIKEQESMAAV